MIQFEDAPGLRPTPARVRETLFNWLQKDITNSVCLDLFAGSGALGFEAASRGARQVVMIESNPTTYQRLKQNAAQLRAVNLDIYQQRAEDFLKQHQQLAFDLVFMDPPFADNLAQALCKQLETWPHLKNSAKIYLEMERKQSVSEIPQAWVLLKDTIAGDVRAQLYQAHTSE